MHPNMLITGISGLIASQCALDLLANGYRVREPGGLSKATPSSPETRDPAIHDSKLDPTGYTR